MKDGNRVEVRSQSLCTKNIYDKTGKSTVPILGMLGK